MCPEMQTQPSLNSVRYQTRSTKSTLRRPNIDVHDTRWFELSRADKDEANLVPEGLLRLLEETT